MSFVKRWKHLWKNTKKKSTQKELYLIYGWASLRVPKGNRCPYVYIFQINTVPNGNAIPIAVNKGRLFRRFVHEHLLWEVPPGTEYGPNTELIRDYDEIIPSAARLPTHRLEMGILRKESGIPRSPFFVEYFCFLPFNGKDSNRVAIRTAGFLASQLEDARVFEGEALKGSKAYWSAAIMAAWRRLRT